MDGPRFFHWFFAGSKGATSAHPNHGGQAVFHRFRGFVPRYSILIDAEGRIRNRQEQKMRTSFRRRVAGAIAVGAIMLSLALGMSGDASAAGYKMGTSPEAGTNSISWCRGC